MNLKKKKNEPQKKNTKAPSVVVSAINPTFGLRLTSTRPRTPPIITSLSDLTIPCSSVTNNNHHKIRAPPWQTATTTWWEWGWGWVGEWMRVRVRVTRWGVVERKWEWERWEAAAECVERELRENERLGLGFVISYIYIYIYIWVFFVILLLF